MDEPKADVRINVTVKVPEQLWAKLREVALKEKTTAQTLTAAALADFLKRWT